MKLRIAAALALGLAATAAHAEIVVGVSLASPAPAPRSACTTANAYQLMGKTLGGEPVRFVILDDASIRPTRRRTRAS